jgi:hypothetical protein
LAKILPELFFLLKELLFSIPTFVEVLLFLFELFFLLLSFQSGLFNQVPRPSVDLSLDLVEETSGHVLPLDDLSLSL